MKIQRFDEDFFPKSGTCVAFWKLLLLGAAAGTANGWFGAGGGLILVPLFSRWLKLPEKTAFATSLAVMAPISLTSLVVYLLRGGVEVAFAWPYLIGGLIGGALAVPVFSRLPVKWLRRALGIFLLYGGVRAVLLL